MNDLAFRDGVMDRIRLREPRYHEHAYLFVLSALEYCQARLTERRHLSGRELLDGCRALAIERYGLLARTVLDYWGVTATSDFGDVVFALVELGLLQSQPNDTKEEFADVYDFEDAFDRDYPWKVAPVA